MLDQHHQTLLLLIVEAEEAGATEGVVMKMEMTVPGAVLGATVQISTSHLKLKLDRINALSSGILFTAKPAKQQKRF